MKYFLFGFSAAIAVIFASCTPWQPRNPPPPDQQQAAQNRQAQPSQERSRPDSPPDRRDEPGRGGGNQGSRNEAPQITETPPDPDPSARPRPEPEPTIQVARPVPGKPGFVFSPFNNKIIDVKDFPSGTLVADPTYPKSEKKYFRVP